MQLNAQFSYRYRNSENRSKKCDDLAIFFILLKLKFIIFVLLVIALFGLWDNLPLIITKNK